MKTRRFCQRCGKALPANRRFCEYCGVPSGSVVIQGTPGGEPRRDGEAGTQSERSSRFCTYCGTVLSSEVSCCTSCGRPVSKTAPFQEPKGAVPSATPMDDASYEGTESAQPSDQEGLAKAATPGASAALVSPAHRKARSRSKRFLTAHRLIVIGGLVLLAAIAGAAIVLLARDSTALYSLSRGGMMVVVDRSGRQVSPDGYDFVGKYSEDRIPVAQNGKMGFLDSSGELATEMKFETKPIFVQSDYEEHLYPYECYFSEGLAAVYIDGRVGFIDSSGEFVIEAFCDDALAFSEGLAAVKVGEKWGFIDRTGLQVVPLRYDEVQSFSEGFAAVKSGTWGFIDVTGAEVISPVFTLAWSFSEGLAAVEENELFGYIDRSGDYAINPQYFWAEPFSEGLAAVYRWDAWEGENGVGYIDRHGQVVIDFAFASGGPFSEGLATVSWEFLSRLEDGLGCIDRTGRQVIPPLFNSIGPFEDGLARVYRAQSAGSGYIDTSGDFVLEDE